MSFFARLPDGRICESMGPGCPVGVFGPGSRQYRRGVKALAKRGDAAWLRDLVAPAKVPDVTAATTSPAPAPAPRKPARKRKG